jgi:hypothetical protein
MLPRILKGCKQHTRCRLLPRWLWLSRVVWSSSGLAICRASVCIQYWFPWHNGTSSLRPVSTSARSCLYPSHWLKRRGLPLLVKARSGVHCSVGTMRCSQRWAGLRGECGKPYSTLVPLLARRGPGSKPQRTLHLVDVHGHVNVSDLSPQRQESGERL